MNLVIGDLLTINKEKYIILDIVLYNNINYAFVNKLTLDENPTNEFYTFKIMNNGTGVSIVKDEKILNELLPLFSKNVQILIDKVTSYNGR